MLKAYNNDNKISLGSPYELHKVVELGVIDSMGESIRIDSIWRIKNQWGLIRPWWSRHRVASHCTAYNSSCHERKLRKKINQVFFTFVFMSLCIYS